MNVSRQLNFDGSSVKRVKNVYSILHFFFSFTICNGLQFVPKVRQISIDNVLISWAEITLHDLAVDHYKLSYWPLQKKEEMVEIRIDHDITFALVDVNPQVGYSYQVHIDLAGKHFCSCYFNKVL